MQTKEEIKTYNKKYREDNKEKIKEQAKQYCQEHKEEKKEYDKIYRQKNRERISKHDKEYFKKYYLHPEVKVRMKEYSKEYDQRPERKKYFKEYAKRPERKKHIMKHALNRYHTDKNFNLKTRLRCLLTQAFKYYSQTGKIMTSKQYGIDFKAIIEHLKPFPEDLSLYHIHHIKPLFTFDLNNSEEIKKAFAPENHKLMLIEDHRKINHYKK